MDPAAMQAALQQMVQQVVQPLAQAVQQQLQALQNQHQPPPPPPPVVFNRSPLGSAQPGDLINYGTKEGIKFHSMATRALFPKDEYFDVEPNQFNTFMTLLASRCKDLGFTTQGGICMVPPDAANPLNGEPINIVEDFGRANLDQIRQWETTFLNANAGAPGRHAQDSKILYDMLMNSLSTRGTARIEIWKHQYCFAVGPNNDMYESGGCLLKVIVRESYLDSTATVSSLRLKLSSMDTYVHENGTDIIALNAHARSLVDGLAARGQRTEDLLVNLFKAYKVCPDVQFKAYITALENGHEDGREPLEPDVLMERTSNYYKKRLDGSTDKWEEDKETKAELLAMEARLRKLEKLKSKVTFKQDSRKKKGAKNDAKKPKASNHPEKPGWLKNNEKPSDPTKSRHFNGTEWYWCDASVGGKCGGAWGTHKPSECRGTRGKRKGDQGTDAKRARKAKKIIKAQQALLNGLEDSDSEE